MDVQSGEDTSSKEANARELEAVNTNEKEKIRSGDAGDIHEDYIHHKVRLMPLFIDPKQQGPC